MRSLVSVNSLIGHPHRPPRRLMASWKPRRRAARDPQAPTRSPASSRSSSPSRPKLVSAAARPVMRTAPGPLSSFIVDRYFHGYAHGYASPARGLRPESRHDPALLPLGRECAGNPVSIEQPADLFIARPVEMAEQAALGFRAEIRLAGVTVLTVEPDIGRPETAFL